MCFELYILLLGLSEHDAQMMADSNENNMDNVTQIVFPNQQDKIKKDIPQVNNNIYNLIMVFYVINSIKCIIY